MPTDQQVTSRHVLRALAELKRVGSTKALTHLEQTEPDLAEFVMEGLTTIYHKALDAGASTRQASRIHHQARTLVLVSITAIQQAHFDLWRGSATGTRLGQIDPTLAKPPPHTNPPDNPPPNGEDAP